MLLLALSAIPFICFPPKRRFTYTEIRKVETSALDLQQFLFSSLHYSHSVGIGALSSMHFSLPQYEFTDRITNLDSSFYFLLTYTTGKLCCQFKCLHYILVKCNSVALQPCCSTAGWQSDNHSFLVPVRKRTRTLRRLRACMGSISVTRCLGTAQLGKMFSTGFSRFLFLVRSICMGLEVN